MTTKIKTLNVCGDELSIEWNGNVWVSPSNGQQHSRAEGAMRVEIETYFSASGKDIEDEITAEEIDEHLSRMG